MEIANNIMKEHLKNVYFLCGGAYGGKTAMAKLIEEKHGFIRYRQGDHSEEYFAMANAVEQPVMSLDRSSDWHGFFAQPPRQYADWMQTELREEAEFTIADLLRIILSFPNGEELLKNVVQALNIDNASERQKFIESGFRYLERSDCDTIEHTLGIIEQHFGLI